MWAHGECLRLALVPASTPVRLYLVLFGAMLGERNNVHPDSSPNKSGSAPNPTATCDLSVLGSDIVRRAPPSAISPPRAPDFESTQALAPITRCVEQGWPA